MTRALYIDDQRVDLPDGVRFQLTFEIADFGELKPRGSGSNTIKLPKTPRNTSIFENCNFVQVDSKFPYLVHSAYYYEDGWLIFSDATVYMLAITQTDFEIQCVWGNSNTIRELKGFDMGGVANLGNVNYQPVTYGYIETGMKGIYGNIEAFELATYRGLRSPFTRGLLNIKQGLDNIPGFSAEYSPAVLAYLDHLYAFPAVSKAKIAYSNVEFSGNISNKFVEYKNQNALLPTDPTYRKAFFIPIATNDRTVTTQGGTPFDGIIAPFTLPGGWYDVSVEVSGIELLLYNNSVDGKGKVIGPSVFVIGQVLAGNDNTKYTVETDSSLVMNIDEDWRGNPSKTYTASKRIYIDDTEVDMGNGVSAVPQLYCALWPTQYDQGGSRSLEDCYITATVKITMSAVQALTEVDINMPDETTDGTKNYITVAMNDLLRGTSAYEFITQAVINAGAIFDSKDGKTRVYTYDDIVNNAAEMLDWSDKLVYIKEENTFNQSGGSQNEIKYKPTEYYNGFGDGSYEDPLAQKLSKDNQTVVENSLFGFNNGMAKVSTYSSVTFIPFVLEKTDKDGNKTYEYKDSGWNLVKLTDTNAAQLTNINGTQVKPIYQSKLTDGQQPTFGNIRATNWAKCIALNQKYRKAKALFMLSPRDVAELDFKKPVYLRQYAQAYIVTKVDYQRNGSTVEMLLIR